MFFLLFSLFPLFSRFPHVSPLPHLYWFPSFFCFLLNINNEYVTVYIVLIALFFIYFLILNYSSFPPYSSPYSSVCVCIFCFLTKTNRYLASFISHVFSRSDFVSHVSSTDNTRNIVPQLCLCVCGVCELETKRKMKSFKWW